MGNLEEENLNEQGSMMIIGSNLHSSSQRQNNHLDGVTPQ